MRRYARLLGVVAFLGILLIIFEVSGLRDRFDLAFIQELILRHRVGGFLLFVLLFSLGNLIQVPGWLFLAADRPDRHERKCARRHRGDVCNDATPRAAERQHSGGDALRSIDNRIAVRILSQLDRHPIRSVALLRMLFQTAPPLNYALALSGIGWRPYLAGTLLGLPLPIAAYCIFFDLLASGLHAR